MFVNFNKIFVKFYVVYFLTNYIFKLNNLKFKTDKLCHFAKCLRKGHFLKRDPKFGHFAKKPL